jgi:hypothetical protein
MTQSSDNVQAPPSPTYAEVGSAVRVLDGEPVKRVRNLMNTIFDQAGSAPLTGPIRNDGSRNG